MEAEVAAAPVLEAKRKRERASSWRPREAAAAAVRCATCARMNLREVGTGRERRQGREGGKEEGKASQGCAQRGGWWFGIGSRGSSLQCGTLVEEPHF